MKDLHTKRVYRLYDFTKTQTITPDQLWCVSGKVNRAGKLYLVIESVKADAKNRLPIQLQANPDRAGENAME